MELKMKVKWNSIRQKNAESSLLKDFIQRRQSLPSFQRSILS